MASLSLNNSPSTPTAILHALADGRALPASELATALRLSRSAVDAALLALVQTAQLVLIQQGAHRYYRLAQIASTPTVTTAIPTPIHTRIDPALQRARMCYKHLAGRLGVAICDAMQAAHQVEIDNDVATLTDAGRAFLNQLGIATRAICAQRPSSVCRMDWSERRPHLAGALGKVLCQRLVELRWVRAYPGRRIITITDTGVRGFESIMGIAMATVL